MKTITTTKTKAINLAKEILKSENKVKRLAYSTFKNTSINCGCGESSAVEVTAQIKGEFYYKTVGICKHCANN